MEAAGIEETPDWCGRPIARRDLTSHQAETTGQPRSRCVVEKGDVPVRVGLKEREDPVPLCYCFGFSLADVRREIAETGRCGIPARITAEVRAGRCSCEVKNPSGVCCLGEVNRAVREEQNAAILIRRPIRVRGDSQS